MVCIGHGTVQCGVLVIKRIKIRSRTRLIKCASVASGIKEIKKRTIMIGEDYVSFETAKLLKEKEFNEPTYHDYDEEGKRWFEEVLVCHNSEGGIACPTLQMVMKWLREIHHYYIQIMLDSWDYGGHMGYYVVIQKTDSDFFEMMLQNAVGEIFYQTHEEACEAAIKYCLENLI